MGIKEFIQNLGERSRERKELMKQADDQIRVQKVLEDRQKSANERELERYVKEEREVEIKQALEYYRKKKDNDVKFGHNPINTPNIMKAQWEVMKEKNQFSNSPNVCVGHKSVLKNNRNLLKNNERLLR
jgi:hypothetical protein